MTVVMQKSVSVPANSTVVNVLSDEKYNRSPINAVGSIYNTGSAVGLRATINVGGFSVSDTVDVGAANRVPVVPDDVLNASWNAPKGQLIQLQVENTTGGALTYFWRVELAKAPMRYRR